MYIAARYRHAFGGLSVRFFGRPKREKPCGFCRVFGPLTAGTEAHLFFVGIGFRRLFQAFMRNSICIPSMLPFITSQFMPRRHGDRPDVIPQGFKNLAFIGQYCEIPHDTVFTVEYSVRAAKVAVTKLLGLRQAVPPIYQGKFNLKVLMRAAREVMR
jgi:myosin-crossreactive antigen